MAWPRQLAVAQILNSKASGLAQVGIWIFKSWPGTYYINILM